MKIAAASLSDDALFRQVAGIIHEVTGVALARITRDARLLEDLGIYGGDGHDLFEALHDRFEMDWTGLELGLHVGVEGGRWPWQTDRRPDGFQPQPLNVAALMAALRIGRWPEYPRIAPSGGPATKRRIASWAAFFVIGGLFVTALAATLSRAGS